MVAIMTALTILGFVLIDLIIQVIEKKRATRSEHTRIRVAGVRALP